MTLNFRRVVTGHDDAGNAIVKYDGIAPNVTDGRPGHSACVVLTTDSAPAYNTGDWDEGTRPVATTNPGGSVFRIVKYGAGIAPIRSTTPSSCRARSTCASTARRWCI